MLSTGQADIASPVREAHGGMAPSLWTSSRQWTVAVAARWTGLEHAKKRQTDMTRPSHGAARSPLGLYYMILVVAEQLAASGVVRPSSRRVSLSG